MDTHDIFCNTLNEKKMMQLMTKKRHWTGRLTRSPAGHGETNEKITKKKKIKGIKKHQSNDKNETMATIYERQNTKNN